MARIFSRRWPDMKIDDQTEWLEADGLGGFASGTTAGRPDASVSRAAAHGHDAANGPNGPGERLRRVGRHAGRLVCALDAAIRTGRAPSDGAIAHQATSRTIRGRLGIRRWPTAHASTRRSSSRTAPARSSSSGAGRAATAPSCFALRPFFSGRDYHAIHHENGAFRFDADGERGDVTFWPRTTACPRSCRCRMATTPCAGMVSTTFCTPPNASAAWTHARISRLPASSAGRSSRRRASRVGARAAVDGPREALTARTTLVSFARLRGARSVERRERSRRPRSRRGRVSRAARRRQDDRRRISLVHRLGPRHVHRPPRPVPGDGAPRRGARHPARVGRRASRKACCRTAFPITARRPSSIRSMRRCGTSSRSTSCCERGRRRRDAADAEQTAGARSAVDAILDGYAGGTRFGIRAGRRRPARRRRARRAAHLDGRAASATGW